MCITMPFIFDPIVAEAVTTWKLVEFCRDLEIQQVIKREILCGKNVVVGDGLAN
jgi:hypothetical protein